MEYSVRALLHQIQKLDDSVPIIIISMYRDCHLWRFFLRKTSELNQAQNSVTHLPISSKINFPTQQLSPRLSK